MNTLFYNPEPESAHQSDGHYEVQLFRIVCLCVSRSPWVNKIDFTRKQRKQLNELNKGAFKVHTIRSWVLAEQKSLQHAVDILNPETWNFKKTYTCNYFRFVLGFPEIHVYSFQQLSVLDGNLLELIYGIVVSESLQLGYSEGRESSHVT